MTLYAETVKQFVQDSYQLISANSPTVPLYGNDMFKGVQFLNQLLKYYSSSSLLLTIAKKVNFTIQIGQLFTTFGDPTYVPTPDVTQGRLSNLERAWLELDGVDYPLINEDRGVFFGSYKYFPQLGLPRFVIITNDLNLTTMQFYPGPSQIYNVWVYGKFELSYISENDTMASLPLYYYRFFKIAVARELAFYKGRSSVWDAKLEAIYEEAKYEMESASTMDLVIDSANESYLNGSWRLRAGI
jgi:hypothetical protein